MTRVAIIGASGYTGAELIRLLLQHPHVALAGLYARRQAGRDIADVFPHFRGLVGQRIESFDAERVAGQAEIAFCALPHGQSAPAVAELVDRGLRVIDLSADFRLRDPAAYATWYGTEATPEHPAPELIKRAVYGLPERYRADIVDARIVAGPGCYPTGAILALAPLLEHGLITGDGLILDSKSGASGAGRSPGVATHFPEAGEGVRPYKVAGRHRHTAEIEQELGALAGDRIALTFTPHLLPMSRGILTCGYATPTDPTRTADDYRAALAESYRDEPFIDVLPAGVLPDTAHVRGSNRAHVAVEYDRRTQRVLALSAIDNLVKGASGQAIQCLNLMKGWDETTGLESSPLFP